MSIKGIPIYHTAAGYADGLKMMAGEAAHLWKTFDYMFDGKPSNTDLEKFERLLANQRRAYNWHGERATSDDLT